jgi:hypothetical protein
MGFSIENLKIIYGGPSKLECFLKAGCCLQSLYEVGESIEEACNALRQINFTLKQCLELGFTISDLRYASNTFAILETDIVRSRVDLLTLYNASLSSREIILELMLNLGSSLMQLSEYKESFPIQDFVITAIKDVSAL